MEASLNSARSLGARTVHIKMYPTARSFPERREVLRVLERFGEVSMFRSLKYYPRAPVPNAFLSLFSSEAAAKDAINASPIRYRLISEPSQSPSPTASLDTSPAEEAQAKATETKPAEDEKIFELHVSHSDFDHTLYLTSPKTNPLHGPFKPVDPKYSYIAASLDRSVPKSLWAAGLKDWETDSVKWRNGPVLGRDLEISQGMGTSVAHRVAQRERQRREKAIPRAMSGLRALREERERRVGPKAGEEQG